MDLVATVLVVLVALIHVWILVLEALLWQTPRGRAAFGTTPEFAARTRVLAANQGLYNGFLAVGLLWGAIAEDPVGFAFRVFFLGCVIVAGVFGAVTASRRILLVQAVPAAVALTAVLLARG